MTFTGGLTMAKYQITIEFTTRLSREVDADSAQNAEQLADLMFQEYLKGENTHIVGTDHHRSIELLAQDPSGRWLPVGQ
jgi:hypothetical protein